MDGSDVAGRAGLVDGLPAVGSPAAGPDGADDGGALAAALEQAASANESTAINATGRANRVAEGELICARRPSSTIGSGRGRRSRAAISELRAC